MNNFANLFEILLTILALLASVFLLPWLKQRLGAEKLKALWKLVCIAVQAAEQLFPSSKSGIQKKQCALDWLASQGHSPTDPLLLQMLEAAVREFT